MRSTLGVGLLAILGPCVWPLVAQAQDRLELRIAADKDQYQLGEPVILYVTLRNAGVNPVEVARLLSPEYEFVKYRVKEPGGETVQFVPWAIKDHPAPSQRLAAGGEVHGVAKIFYGGHGWTFQRPGSYEVTATYRDQVTSNPLKITVAEPRDQATRRAAEVFLGSDEAGRFLLLEGGDHLSEGIRHLQQVAQEFGDTPHATYANYALGASLMSDFADFKANRLRKAEPRTARDYLERASARPVGRFDTARSNVLLLDAYSKLGEQQKADAVRRELNRISADPGMRQFIDQDLERRGIGARKNQGGDGDR
jgi:hypothetical protein